MRYPPAPHGLKPIAATGPGPIYRQVKREIQRVVETGRYGPGETLPSETVIARALGVSIGTLRKAVDELVHETVLVRRQGKGTFVSLHNDERFLFQFFHVEPRGEFPAQVDEAPHEYPQVDCVAFARAKSDEAEAAALRLNPGDPVWRFENRLSLGGRPVVHDRIAISANVFSKLTQRLYLERPGTIYSLYQTEFGITVLRAHERARAAGAGLSTARVLGIAEGTPVLQVHRLALTFGDKPVEYRISTINTAAHDYVSMLARQGQVLLT